MASALKPPITGHFEKFKVLVKLLAIPLGRQTTSAKWLVISKTRREQKITTQHMVDM